MSDNTPLEAIQGMINRLEDRFDLRFDRLDEKVDEVAKTTDRNTIVLEEHQRRALANEKHTNLLEKKLDLHRQEFSSGLKKHEDASAIRDKDLELQQKELAESVELIVKFPRFVYKIAIWLAAFTAGAGALWAIVRFAVSYVGQ